MAHSKGKTGDGTVYKLSGKRSKPWIARKAIGTELISKTEFEYVDRKTGKLVPNPTPEQLYFKKVKKRCKRINPSDYSIHDLMEMFEKKEVSQTTIYFNIGYFETKQEAYSALNAYNKNPYDITFDSTTFADCYEKWSESYFETISQSNIQAYKASYKLCDSIKDMKMTEIKLDHLQKIVDESGKNTPTLRKLKILFGQVFDYAVMHDIVTQDRRDKIKYVDISKAGNPNAYDRKPFTHDEVDIVWKWKDSSPYIKVILMLIYSGVRIGELLDLKKENINLEEQWFDVTASKTQAGIRKVPIADKILPFFQEWYEMNDCEYLISTPEGNHFEYRNYYDSYWKPFIEQMGLNHTPHCTRHTCISMLTEVGIDERIIRKIVGHKGQGVTEVVYTHLEIAELLDAINKI